MITAMQVYQKMRKRDKIFLALVNFWKVLEIILPMINSHMVY